MVLRFALALFPLGLGTALAGERETGWINAEDGVRISYTSEGHGETAIVFIHGWTLDHTHWRFQIKEFSKSFRVIAIDLPGHGASGANRKSWTYEGLGADVSSVVRGLKLQRVILVGHSMGGPVALAAAPKLRGILRGIVAVDSVQNVEYSVSPDAVKPFIKMFEDDFEGTWARFTSRFFEDPNSEILRALLDKPNRTDRKAAILLLAAHNRFDAKSALAAAGVPVRALNAAEPYRTEVEINRKYGDFDAVLLPNAGHFFLLEEPVEFNRHLRIMIEELRKD